VIVLACAFALAAVNAGVAGAEPLSKREWRAQVKSICVDANDEVSQKIQDVVGDLKEGERPTDDQFREMADGVAPILEGAIDDVNDLEEPVAFKKGVKRWLAAFDDVVEEIRDDPLTLDKPDPLRKPNKLAKKLGLHGCA
jgi:hypothetical protein